ncbi:MAG: isoprenylcysteine carboxylmethyltransferase family protein [Planctomycetes bacterium]|nr:isoprenylcysteine carboxylmethyltransferase family protein [Planctomycetota bacterium]
MSFPRPPCRLVQQEAIAMKRTAIFIYGVACYAVFLAVFLYAIGFIGNLGAPTALDASPTRPLVEALLIDTALLLGFALQHSGMARQGFKRWWMRVIPVEAERSTYVLASSAAMVLLFAFWQGFGGTLWEVQGSARLVLHALNFSGWALVLVTTFLIDHFDLFGLTQSWRALRGKPYEAPRFRTPGIYRFVRHPLYVGWLVVFWAAPTMTLAHLVCSAAITGYILVAIRFEERDLLTIHGADYARYRETVPMLIPGAPLKGAKTT